MDQLLHRIDTIVNLTPILESSIFGFLIPIFNNLYFRNLAVNFVEICNICAKQMVIKGN